LVTDGWGAWGTRVGGVVVRIGGFGPFGCGGAPVLPLRADMDALPIQEATGLPYASQVDGVMHACGHDGHTAMLLAAARHLVESPHWRGTLQLIFQPAEEGLGGARAMLDDGLL
ncbi:M20/M25/M40 family metallo-hydrolase, partial [Pseudomonas aeruginosa]